MVGCVVVVRGGNGGVHGGGQKVGMVGCVVEVRWGIGGVYGGG